MFGENDEDTFFAISHEKLPDIDSTKVRLRFDSTSGDVSSSLNGHSVLVSIVNQNGEFDILGRCKGYESLICYKGTFEPGTLPLNPKPEVPLDRFRIKTVPDYALEVIEPQLSKRRNKPIELWFFDPRPYL